MGVTLDMVLAGEIRADYAAAMLVEIQKDPESYLVAKFLGWKYRPSSAERAAWDMTELELNSQRKKGSRRIKLPRPWHDATKESGAGVRMVPVDSPERAEALERLNKLK